MQQALAVRVAPANSRDHAIMLELRVRADQRAWVGGMADVLADLARCPNSESMSIWRDRHVVGHYRIDPDARSVSGRDFVPQTLGLRAFFIDARWQGLGLGKAALDAMLVDLVTRHARARQLALCVSADNHVARHLYLHTGFVDGGELYHDGRGQAQHLLLHTLP